MCVGEYVCVGVWMCAYMSYMHVLYMRVGVSKSVCASSSLTYTNMFCPCSQPWKVKGWVRDRVNFQQV